MNRLLIVDDEHHIVNWIAELFTSLDEPELEIMKAYSGYETLEILKKYRMDVILLDIQMPKMTGLEVAERTLAQWPATRIIFLTAYENFDYLYQANRLTNTSYLLKTESDEAIINEVKKNLGLLQAEKEKNIMLEEAAAEKLLLNHLMQQDYLRKIYYSGSSIPEIYNEYDGSLHFSKSNFLLYTMVSSGSFKRSSSLSNQKRRVITLLSLVSGFLYDRFNFAMLELESNSMLWFFQDKKAPSNSEVSSLSFLRNLSEYMIESADKLPHCRLNNILYENPVLLKDVCHIGQSMRQYAESDDRQNGLSASSSTLLAEKTLREYLHSLAKRNSGLIDSADIRELSFHLLHKDQKSYAAVFAKISKPCVNRKSMHDLTVIHVYYSIALMLMQIINRDQLETMLAMKTALYPLYHIQTFSTWKTAFEYLLELSQHILFYLAQKEDNRNEHLIAKVEKYIRYNLSHPLSISDVASVINYNATYVSRIYRLTRGISLTDFITKSRIEMAVELLTTTGEPIQEIARQTGFDTAQYFSIVFKKETGLSPRDYRNAYLQKDP